MCDSSFPPSTSAAITVIRLRQIMVLVCAFGGKAAAEEPGTDSPAAAVIESITFDTAPGKLYVPVEEAAVQLGWTIAAAGETQPMMLNTVAVTPEDRRNLVDGTELVSADGLGKAGAEVNLHPSGQSATIISGSKQFTLMRAEKRVEVSLAEQRLRAWQGNRLVLETKVSSGRRGRTPAGNFHAGPFKARMHRSSRYHNAPMPWSVQINGHVFIHGFTSVPDYPASHGCIRVPLTGGNPARFFYEWVDRGTPVRVLQGIKPKPPVSPEKPVLSGKGRPLRGERAVSSTPLSE